MIEHQRGSVSGGHLRDLGKDRLELAVWNTVREHACEQFLPLLRAIRTSQTGAQGEMRKITVLRSNDMKNWTEFLTTEVGAGAGIQVVDCTREGQMFYRVEMTLP
jgi:hypothetical protein